MGTSNYSDEFKRDAVHQITANAARSVAIAWRGTLKTQTFCGSASRSASHAAT